MTHREARPNVCVVSLVATLVFLNVTCGQNESDDTRSRDFPPASPICPRPSQPQYSNWVFVVSCAGFDWEVCARALCRVTAWIRLQADVIGPKNWLNYKQPSYL